jgi:hypothetical protein
VESRSHPSGSPPREVYLTCSLIAKSEEPRQVRAREGRAGASKGGSRRRSLSSSGGYSSRRSSIAPGRR